MAGAEPVNVRKKSLLRANISYFWPGMMALVNVGSVERSTMMREQRQSG
jgi:hypothetical protein